MNKSDEAVAHEILQELGTPDLSEEQKVFKKVCAIISRHRHSAAIPKHRPVTDEEMDFLIGWPAAVSADAVEVAKRICEHFDIDLGQNVHQLVGICEQYGDACRLDGARKMQEAAAIRVQNDIHITSIYEAAQSIRALSPETVCGVSDETKR